MADTAIGEAAKAVAAEGGAVLLLPNEDAERDEAGMADDPEPEPSPQPPVVVEIAAPPPEPPLAVPSEEWRGIVQSHEERLQTAEQRLAMMEANHVAFRTDLDGRAFAQHEHAPDEDVRILAEELRAIREEEVAPRRGRVPQRGWLGRWLRGEGRA